jgi:NAD(P)-dependent dehydrogenase (short-subunit alcohol dehydrogenase family)
MREFEDKVAVVTGGSSGIGRALVERFARERMKVVIADIDEEALAETDTIMKASGATILPIVVDVSKLTDVKVLARKTLEAFGVVHILCNNAGVMAGNTIWETTFQDWKWVIDVNLWGVIYGLRVFVPLMLEQDTDCHIINTASIAGLTSEPYCGTYRMTKHAVVSLSETLYHELNLINAKVKVSVLCPEWVKTRLDKAEQHRPLGLRNKPDEQVEQEENPNYQKIKQFFYEGIQSGISSKQVAGFVLDAIKNDKFYILTHPESKRRIQMRMKDILGDRNPTNMANIMPG